MESSNPKRDRKAIFDPKKPWLWIILAAILCAVAAVLCLLILPKKNSDPVHANADTAVIEWLDYQDSFGEMPWEGTKELTLDAFPNVSFFWTFGAVDAVENGETRTLFSGMPVVNIYVTDVTGDGRPDFCASVYFGSGIVDEHVVVYDYAEKQSYTLWDRGTFDYHLYTVDGALHVGKTPYGGDKQVDCGTLVMHEGAPACVWQDGSFTPLNRELHESELYGEWLVKEETDADGNVLYSLALDLWKEYHFREDGTVVYNETVPISSDSELAFGHPVSYPYEVHDNYVYIAGDDASGAFRWGPYDRETGTLHLMYDTPDGTVHAALERMGADSTDEGTLDESVLCTIWRLTEIEAPDGSNGDAKGLGLKQYLVFRLDGTVRLIDMAEDEPSDRTTSYTLNGNTVRFEGRVLRYDSGLKTLVWIDPSSQDILFYSPAPNAVLPPETP